MKFKILGIISIFVQPYIAMAASFDCGLANGFVEKTICSDPELSKLDEELNSIYGNFRSNSESSAIITQQQFAWLKERNSCKDKNCIIEKYNNRILELKSSTAPASKPLKLTREYCREKAKQPDVVKCITEKIWDPCSEGAGGSSWWGSQCGWAHLEIAENEIKEIQKKIENLLISVKKENELKSFKESEVMWFKYRDQYCEFTNGLAILGGDQSLSVAFCKLRLSEAHANELSKTYPEIKSVIEYIVENP